MKFNLVKRLFESKADEQRLIDFAGEDLAKRFLTIKQRLKSPENDIYYWLKKSVEELENRVSEIENTATRKQREDEAQKGAELIYNKDGWRVYHITTYEASVKYGKNTQWCIAGSKRWSNGEHGEEYFNDYTEQGIKFYFYIKSNNEKYALALSPNGEYQVFNAVDDEVNGTGILPSVEGLPIFEAIKTYVYNGEPLDYNIKETIGTDTTIEFDPDIDEIYNEFFSKTKISHITIPSTIRKISYDAFANCQQLLSVEISDKVREIEDGAFVNCFNLVNINIPKRLFSITPNCFTNCASIENIEIPEGVHFIGSYSFSNCESLEKIEIPDSVEAIYTGAFSGCTSLKSVKLNNKIDVIPQYCFSKCGDLQSIKIPNSVVKIDVNAFYNCKSLQLMEIPDSVVYIHPEAFKGCDNLHIIANENSRAWKWAKALDIPVSEK